MSSNLSNSNVPLSSERIQIGFLHGKTKFRINCASDLHDFHKTTSLLYPLKNKLLIMLTYDNSTYLPRIYSPQDTSCTK